ncbi:MAG TPA: tripartite tricarboxylate transporter substrate binding protein [Xanthobacteraceae bacterium]|nr:tripartite tricarboxylate transporter substrate binding protein [Xanthobacteraceae bacterium]
MERAVARNNWSYAARRALAALAVIAASAMPSPAQDYPSRPIHILVPYAPGGIADIAARIVGAKITEAWGQQVVVENRPGGNGFIAVTDAVRSAADGYTLVMATGGDVAINPVLFKKVPYDVARDLAPIASVSDAPLVLAVNADTLYRTVADVIAAAKAKPNEINVCTPGYGSINQIVLEWMALNSGTKFVHVPYKGGAPAAQALMAGDIPVGILASSSVAPGVQSGRIRVLAVTMAKRSALDPQWPTLQEEGIKEVDASNWTALFAPKATPQPIIDKLGAEVVKILAMPDVKERFAAGGVVTIPSTAAELDARIKRELSGYRAIIEKADIHVD